MGAEECKHGMNPEWCAECLGHQLPEDKEKNEDGKIIKNIMGWT